MPNNNENITTSFSVDISELKAGIQEANRQIKLANSEFKNATAGMDNWADSADGLTAKLNQLAKIEEAEKKKLEALQIEYRQVVEAQGENSVAAQNLAIKLNNQEAKVKGVTKEIGSYNAKLEELEAGADEAADSLENLERQTAEAGEGFTITKGALSGFIANAVTNAIGKVTELAGSMFTLAEETKEYRTLLGKTEGSAINAGYSIEYAAEKYRLFNKYLSDDQAATNAITNLMGLKVETGTLDKLVQGSIATWTAYGDSINVEALTEAAAESINVSKVVGSLADVLNWTTLTADQWNAVLGKGSKAQAAYNKAIAEGLPVEDAFSEALAATTDKQERANLVANLLNTTFGESKKVYDEVNGSILNANAAEEELKATQAELAKTIEPLNTEFTKLKNKALKALSPSIKEVTGDFLELVEDVDYSGATEEIGDLMNTTAKGLKFVVENIKPISAGLKVMATAWLAYKAAQLAALATTKVANATLVVTEAVTKRATAGTIAHTTATNASTVATKALALAQKATPWGLVASLVAVAVAGIGTYIAKTKEATREASKNTEATDKVAKSYKEYSAALKDNVEARKEVITNAQAEAQSAEVLLDRTAKLAETEEKSAGQKALLKQYVEQLNELMPELNLQYDEEEDKLNKTTEAIREQIQAQKELTLAKAAQGQLQEIAEDMVKAEIELATATKQHAKNKEALAKAEAATAKAQQEYLKGWITQDQYLAVVAAEDEAEKAYNKTSKAIKGLKGDLEGLEEEYASTEGYAQLQLNNAEITKSLQALSVEAQKAGVEIPAGIEKGIRSGMYTVPKTVDELKALINYEDAVARANTAGLKIPTSIADGIKSGKLTPSQAVEQINGLIEAEALKPQSKLKTAGTNDANSIASGLTLGALAVKKAAEKAAEKGVEGAESKNGDFRSAGKSMAEGIEKGTRDNDSEIQKSLVSLASDMVGWFKKKLKIKSPSRIFTSLTSNVPKAIVLALNAGRKPVANAVKKLADQVIAEGGALKSALQLDDMKVSLNSNLGKVRSAVAGASGGLTQTLAGNTTNVVFNQYNTSPKALDSLEVYRNTQRQLKQFKNLQGV